MVTNTERSALQLAPRLSATIMTTVFVGICLVASIRILATSTSFLTSVSCVSYIAVLLVLQLLYISRHPTRMSHRHGLTVLAAMATLTYLPFLQFGEAWVGMPGFLAGSVLLALPTAVPAWVTFGAVVLSVGVLEGVFDPRPLSIGYTVVSTVITGLVVYGLTRLTDLIREMHATRTELARDAVAEERLRVARDLHDLLGYGLSAITLKSELTYRLVSKHPELAKQELSETLFIARQALADVRGVAEGYRELSFDEEVRSVRSVLAAADVTVAMDLAYDDLPIRVGTVLAIVLREAITNLLRHSKAENCEITVRQTAREVHFDIVNDGVRTRVGGGAQVPESSGSGLRNLSARVTAIDGRLSSGLEPDGRFRLTAVVPLTSRRSAHYGLPSPSQPGTSR